jgi:hypothetical protein
MGLATGYMSVLRQAAAAESLTAHGVLDSGREANRIQNPSIWLADVLYNLEAARHKYRCAGQVLDPFRQAADSETKTFVVETRDVFEGYAAWVVFLISDLKRRVRGDSLSVLVEAEQLAEMRRRREALTTWLGLNAIGLTYLLLEARPDNKERLALTTFQRDSLLTELRRMAAGSAADVPATAKTLIDWFNQPWPTR